MRLGLLGNMGRMVVHDQPKGAFRRIVVVQVLKHGNEFDTAVAMPDACGDMSVVQIQRRQDGTGLMLVVAGYLGMRAGDRK